MLASIPFWSLLLIVAIAAFVVARGMISSGMFNEGSGIVALGFAVTAIGIAVVSGLAAVLFVNVALFKLVTVGAFVFAASLFYP